LASVVVVVVSTFPLASSFPAFASPAFGTPKPFGAVFDLFSFPLPRAVPMEEREDAVEDEAEEEVDEKSLAMPEEPLPVPLTAAVPPSLAGSLPRTWKFLIIKIKI
jgi:hypothetical protein